MKIKIFLAMLLCACILNAHAPKSLELSYDRETGALSVKVLHRVSNQATHYIKTISVYAGKELLAEKNYEQQETAEAQEEVFLFSDKPLARGTEVKVTARCNIFGKKSATLAWK